jgi:predicted HTH domain antitoxin
MAITIETVTPQKILELAQTLSPADLHWLQEQLNQLLEEDEPLPEQATLDEAVELFLADKCSLGRAAELAGVTRWDIQDILKERGIPIMIYSSKTVEEMDQLAEELEQEGLLC